MAYIFKHAILGGTFDHLHAGHKHLISSALEASAHVTIGVVVTPFSHDKSFASSIQSYDLRLSNIKSYLKTKNATERTSLIPISDVYGTTLTDPSIEAIFVTSSTHPNALLINKERLAHTMRELQILTVEHLLGDDLERISSSRIRQGLIDRIGHSHTKFLASLSSYTLPPRLRAELAMPIGRLYPDPTSLYADLDSLSLIISVGDIVSHDLLNCPKRPAIYIFDHRSGRLPISTSSIIPKSRSSLPNPAGTINPGFAKLFISALESYYSTKLAQPIEIQGEEDLLTLPSILLSPLGTTVVYGQPGAGICSVTVTEEAKSLVKNYLSQF